MRNLHKLKKDESRDADGEPVYLTQSGIERLREELARLKQRVPGLALEAQRTAAYGDRSDNAEYKQAKGALRRAHYQILEIESKLRRAVAIAAGPSAAGTVQLGSVVEFENRKTFHIVGPSETDPARGRISHLSPLGAALIGHRAGDVVTIKTVNGSEQKYRITAIK